MYEEYLRDHEAEVPAKKVRLMSNEDQSSIPAGAAADGVSKLPHSKPKWTTNSKPPKSSIQSYFNFKPLSMHYRLNEFTEAIVRMVTVNSRPLTIVNDEWFRKLIAPYEKTFSITVNYRFVIECIDEAYKELRSRIISLKADCVTKRDRSFIGINIQFIYDGQVIVVTLGTVPLLNRHTGPYLKNTIVNTLNKFGVGIDQLYTITTDNGLDLTCAARIIEKMTINSTEAEGMGKSEEDENSEDNWDDDEEYRSSDSNKDKFSKLEEKLMDFHDVSDASHIIQEIENISWEGNILISKFVFS